MILLYNIFSLSLSPLNLLQLIIEVKGEIKLPDLFFFFFHRPAWSLLGGKKSVKQRIKLVWPYACRDGKMLVFTKNSMGGWKRQLCSLR